MSDPARVLPVPRDAAELTATVFNIMRFSTHDGPGIRTTVFFKGCPLSCWWCHNPEGQSFLPELFYYPERCRHCGDCIAACPEHAIEEVDGVLRTSVLCRRCGHCTEVCAAEARQLAGRELTLSEVLAEVEKDLIFYEESGGGVTLSGGEPLAQPRFAEALLRACREGGIHTVLETCGFAPSETFLRVAPAADLVLFDLKLWDPERHRQYTGVSNLWILQNLRELTRRQRPVVVRIPIIPGVTGSDGDLRPFADYLAEIGVRAVELLPYHKIGAEKYRRLGLPYKSQDTPEPLSAEMAQVRQTLTQVGLDVQVGG